MILSLLASRGLGQTSRASPEPTVTYTCGGSYQPVDLVFDEAGRLYSTDGQLLARAGGENIYNTELLPSTEKQSNQGFVYWHNSGCEQIGMFYRPFGIEHLGNSLCITHQEPLEGVFGLPFEPALSCWHNGNWQQKFRGYDELQLVANDLVNLSSGLLVATFDDVGIPSIVGILQYFDEGARARSGLFDALQFLDTTISGAILVTSVKQEMNKVQSGLLLKLTIQTQSLSESKLIMNIATLATDFRFPTGVKSLGSRILVVDYQLGELYSVAPDGQIVQVYTGLQVPMGIEQAPNGDICIAEMLGGRISCYSLTSLDE